MKKMNLLSKLFSVCLSFMLIAALALTLTGCKSEENLNSSQQMSTVSAVEIGAGEKYFTFTVEADGEKSVFNIKTDKTTVGESLLELKLIEGDNEQYGLYVKKVNGISADYDKDKAYWAFYEDGKYADSGVDTTDIVNGKTYTFKKEKS